MASRKKSRRKVSLKPRRRMTKDTRFARATHTATLAAKKKEIASRLSLPLKKVDKIFKGSNLAVTGIERNVKKRKLKAGKKKLYEVFVKAKTTKGRTILGRIYIGGAKDAKRLKKEIIIKTFMFLSSNNLRMNEKSDSVKIRGLKRQRVNDLRIKIHEVKG